MKFSPLFSVIALASKYGNLAPSRKNLDENSGVIVVLLGMFLVAPVIVIKWTVLKDWLAKTEAVRNDLFDENGGNLLTSKIKNKNRYYRYRNNPVSLSVYSAKDMNSIAKRYESLYPTLNLGSCHAKFFKGTLEETEVLVVEIERVARPHLKKFVDQLIFLSQPHPNVLRVLGCCLDKISPLIVYELHGEGTRTLSDDYPGSNEARLRAARGVARGLAYLNSRKRSRRTFVHGDISTSTVLVDASYNAKIFYAPASNLIPRSDVVDDESYLCRDPDYISSGKLNKKSDVYSFGVVLVELLPGRRMALESYVHFANTGRLPQNLEREIHRIGEPGGNMMREFGAIAATCLNGKPSQRPSMKEVEAKLRVLMPLPAE